MRKIGSAIFWILASFSLPIAIVVMSDRVATSTNALRIDLERQSRQTATTTSGQFTCQTIIADPNPPLNVRSSPVVAPDNKLATLPNGTPLSVVDENQGWLRITSPIQGWVYKELTVTSCVNPADPLAAQPQTATEVATMDEGAKLLAIATEQYQSGNLTGALSLLKTISPQSAAHLPAQLFLRQWELDWNEAESDYYTAQKALREQRWQAVLDQVNGYPDIRYWREKLAPVVQQAMQQHAATPTRTVSSQSSQTTK